MSFDALIPEARAFLGELARNNRREWFHAHKAQYEAQLAHPARLLLEQIAAGLSPLAGGAVSSKLFRPQRDLRFTKDKTPYHTHLHLLWTSPDGGLWMFGISPEYVVCGIGRMRFSKEELAAWRENLPERGPALLAELEQLQKEGARLSQPELKRPAPPIGAESPLADLARRKSLNVWMDMDPDQRDLPARLMKHFRRLAPAQALLSEALQP